jgi:hypothetical protein
VSGDVWEVAGDEVPCFVWSGGLFIGRSDGDKRGQKLAVAGALAAFEAFSGHGGHARVLGGCWFSRGVLWVSSGASKLVGIARGSRLLGGGPGCVSPPSSSSHGLGRGWGSWTRPWHLPTTGLQHRSELEQCCTSKSWSHLIFFCQCSTKCPQELKIWIFKIFHFGCSSYWIRYPGIFLLQWKVESYKNLYFKFDMVSVSDSNFGSSLSGVLVWNFGRSLLVELVHNLVQLN